MPIDTKQPEITTMLDALNNRKAIVVAGTGISSATFDSKSRTEIGTWYALLNYGIKFCCEKCRKENDWGESCRTLLAKENVSTEELLKVGDEIWDCLEANGKIEEWLKPFENASPEYRDLILALESLRVPIATANYDNLLEDITHYAPITLLEEDRAKVQEFFTNKNQKFILHLHGHYRKPASMVLGQRSYNRIVSDGFAQFINQYIAFQNKAVIFVGFGQGVYDPNFKLIFEWVSKNLPNTTLYHLVLDKYVTETKATHQANNSKNVEVVSYGEKYNDLVPFLKALAINIKTDDDLPKSLDGKPFCIGQNRLDLIEKVANHLKTDYKKPVGILGTGGLGKTNLVLNVLHHPAIARKYRRNRIFVRCDGAKELPLLLTSLSNALEMPLGSGGELSQQVLNYLNQLETEKLIVLDNFETTWEDAKNVEPFIEKLKDYADLVFTYRGKTSPDALDWKTFEVPFINETDAIVLFDSNSEEKFMKNPLVKTMVQEVDYLPLAVELLAKRAKKVEKLESLYSEWQKKKNDFLKITGKENDKNFNLNLSISFSYENTGLTDTNRAFLQAIAYLPSGINRQDLDSLFEESYEQLETLKALGLCEETDQERLWVLAPIREYLKQKTIKNNSFLEKIQNFYVELANEKGGKVGFKDHEITKLLTEWNNIDLVVTETLNNRKSINSLISLKFFYEYNGFYPSDIYLNAIKISQKNRWNMEEASLFKALGDFNNLQFNIQKSKFYYQEALKIYLKIDDNSGIANSYRSIGNLYLNQMEYKISNSYYQKALSYYEKLNSFIASSMGKATCLRGMGGIALRESNFSLANEYFLQSSYWYDKIDNIHGKANCFLGLGELAFKQKNLSSSSNFYYSALALFEKIGLVHGIATSLRGLAKLELESNNLDNAEKLCFASLEMFYKVNDPCSIGFLLIEIGGIKLKKSEIVEANNFICEGKLTWKSAKLDYLVKQMGLEDLECE